MFFLRHTVYYCNGGYHLRITKVRFRTDAESCVSSIADKEVYVEIFVYSDNNQVQQRQSMGPKDYLQAHQVHCTAKLYDIYATWRKHSISTQTQMNLCREKQAK